MRISRRQGSPHCSSWRQFQTESRAPPWLLQASIQPHVAQGARALTCCQVHVLSQAQGIGLITNSCFGLRAEPHQTLDLSDHTHTLLKHYSLSVLSLYKDRAQRR